MYPPSSFAARSDMTGRLVVVTAQETVSDCRNLQKCFSVSRVRKKVESAGRHV